MQVKFPGDKRATQGPKVKGTKLKAVPRCWLQSDHTHVVLVDGQARATWTLSAPAFPPRPFLGYV